jgi:hypothetical protein
MPFTTVNPTSNTTPDPGQGGLAVTSPTNTGHALSTAVATDAADSQQRTCIWSGFANVGGRRSSVILKIDHTSTGVKIGVGASNSFTLDYSVNNGGAWTNAVTRNNMTSSQGPTTFSVALSVGQDLSQVKVRDSMSAATSSNGETANATVTIANIKIEVLTAVPPSTGIM